MIKTNLKQNALLGAWACSLFFSSVLYAFEYQEYEKRVKNSYQVRSLVEKMPRKDIEETLRTFLFAARPSRLIGSAGHKKIEQYLEEKLKAKKVSTRAIAEKSFH